MGAGGSAAVEIIRGHLRHLLIGANPLDVEQLWDQMYSSALLYGRRGLFAMALSAVANALWDIAGKHAGRSVVEMIGGWPRERLPIYQTGGDIPSALARGIRHFKIGTRVGPHTPPDEQRRVAEAVVAARDTVGPDGNLMIDCVSRNGTADWAVGFAQQLRTCTMAESFPTGSPILDAMSPPFADGDYVAPSAPGFGSALTEPMILDARLPGTF